jgi:hypothetical protein
MIIFIFSSKQVPPQLTVSQFVAVSIGEIRAAGYSRAAQTHNTCVKVANKFNDDMKKICSQQNIYLGY